MKTIIFIYGLIISMFLSCDNYLDVKSIASKTIPNSLENLKLLLDDGTTMNYITNSFAEASADDYFLLDKSFNSIIESGRKVYLWENSFYNFPNDWATGYLAVYNSNVVLDALENIVRSDANAKDWDMIKGSALFHRSHALVNQLWTYAKAYNKLTSDSDLGIVLRLNSNPTTTSKRSSVEDCYIQILQDLEKAIEILPNISDNPFRPSKVAAYGLKARILLMMNDFSSALSYVNKALEINSYLIDYEDPAEVNLSASFPFKRFNKETVFFSQLRTGQASLSVNHLLIDTNLYDSYLEGDLRKQAFFNKQASGYVRFKGSYVGSNSFFTGLTTAELFLIKAECLIREGNIDLASKTINTLLSKRWKSQSFIPVDTKDEVLLLKIILDERRKELLLRGVRWIDIKRRNVLGENIRIKRKVDGEIIMLEPNDKRYMLPLPNDIILQAGISQNQY